MMKNNASVKSILESDSIRAPGSKDGHRGVLPCHPSREEGFYPNVDLSIWLRSCVEEVER